MTASRPMFDPLIAAGEPTPNATWLLLVLGLGGAAIGALGTWVLALINNRGQARQRSGERAQKNQDAATAEELTLAGLNLKTLAEAREQWRKDIHDERLRYQAELTILTDRLEELREDNENLKATHVEMYLIISKSEQFFDALRPRAVDGVITFRVDELPAHTDLASIAPANAFRRRSKSATQQISLRVESAPPAKP